MEWSPFKKKNVVRQGGVVVDPTTGAVLGAAKSPEEARQIIRETSQDQREAA